MDKIILYIKIGFLAYLLIINLAAFLTCMVDKRRAKKQQWRIREKTLFLIAIIGGSFGMLMGMLKFHHKTRHWYFMVGMPLILILQIALCGFIVYMRYFH